MKIRLDLLQGPSQSRSHKDQAEIDIRPYTPLELKHRFAEVNFDDVRIARVYVGVPISTEKPALSFSEGRST